MKILILGHARHGKDQFAEFLKIPLISSSKAALEVFLFDRLQQYLTDRGLGQYRDHDHAYDDRIHEREFWFNQITAYNKKDPTKLARAILSKCDCYVGMRNIIEYKACIEAGLFDEVFWVDGSDRKPFEPSESFNIPYDPSMTWVDNNGSLKDLEELTESIRKSRQLGS